MSRVATQFSPEKRLEQHNELVQDTIQAAYIGALRSRRFINVDTNGLLYLHETFKSVFDMAEVGEEYPFYEPPTMEAVTAESFATAIPADDYHDLIPGDLVKFYTPVKVKQVEGEESDGDGTVTFDESIGLVWAQASNCAGRLICVAPSPVGPKKPVILLNDKQLGKERIIDIRQTRGATLHDRIAAKKVEIFRPNALALIVSKYARVD